jgi:uncharacterized protein YbbK (DUF523 family)
MMIVVSACLAGLKCRYDGMEYSCVEVKKLVALGKAIPVCPELLGGLPVPRAPAEICNDRVMTADGNDVTVQFHEGAAIALKIALAVGCRSAILKARSPSCGSGRIYDGSFSGRVFQGDGIFAKMLKDAGIIVQTDEEVIS